MRISWTLWDLIWRGGPTMWILIVLSVVSVGVAIERWLYYRSCRVNTQDFFLRFRRGVKKDDLSALVVLCDETPGPLAALLKDGVRRVMERPLKRDELEAQLTRQARHHLVQMEKNLSLLATVASIAPFVGLFGTVLGIMRAFRDLAVAGSGGTTVVAAGIAEALVATAAGILVAVVAVVAYNYFVRVVRRTGVELELGIGEALDVLVPGKER